jgi:hypothetical protein
MSTLAVFIALGGSSYAAVKLNGKDLKPRSVSASKVKRNSLTGVEIRESQLGRVPWAAYADTLSPEATRELQDTCPAGTFFTAGTCIEEVARRPMPYGSAVQDCLNLSSTTLPRMRLPTHGELQAALFRFKLTPGGELTSELIPSSQYPGELDVLYVTSEPGGVGVTTNRYEGGKAFRCAIDPLG